MHDLVLSAVLMVFLLLTDVQASDTVEADPVETEKVLNILLRHADLVIPESSSCYEEYAEIEKPAIRNLLATSLAHLHNGKNVIMGSCSGNYCKVKITHRAGEDVSSTTIYFSLKDGRIDTANLECIITP